MASSKGSIERGESSSIPGTIEAARRGDTRALGDLLAGYRDYLCLLARTSISSRLQVRMDASDAAQEVLLKAHRGFQEFRGGSEGELVAWLRQVLARTLVDAARRHLGCRARDAGRERAIGQAVDRSEEAIGTFGASSQTSPSRNAERREFGVVLARALAALEPDHREVIILRTLEGEGWQRIGERLQRSPDAARMLWVRALARLRPHLEGRV